MSGNDLLNPSENANEGQNSPAAESLQTLGGAGSFPQEVLPVTLGPGQPPFPVPSFGNGARPAGEALERLSTVE